MNRVFLVGYMVENPTKVETKSGESMTKFKVSVKKKGKPREGETKYNYFNCVAFKHTAEFIYKYCNSQSRIAVTGSIDNYSYTANGQKRYGTQILVDDAEIVSSTVNQGDFQQPQGDPLEQYQQGGGFTEVQDDVDLPFI